MKLTIHRKTHTGKIARLPHAIREELNRHLQNGETGKVILPWLNALPAVQAVLAAQFAAVPVNHQNLSNWRRSGYQDWLEEQRYGNLSRELAENAEEIAPNNGGPVIANNMSTVLMAELAVSFTRIRTGKTNRTNRPALPQSSTACVNSSIPSARCAGRITGPPGWTWTATVRRSPWRKPCFQS